MRYESLCQVIVEAEDVHSARKKIDTRGWLIHRDPYNRFTGKIIPLRGHCQDCYVTGMRVLYVLPYICGKHDYRTRWQGTVLIDLDAPSREEANAFLKIAIWHYADNGVALDAFQEVERQGTVKGASCVTRA